MGSKQNKPKNLATKWLFDVTKRGKTKSEPREQPHMRLRRGFFESQLPTTNILPMLRMTGFREQGTGIDRQKVINTHFYNKSNHIKIPLSPS